jgi:type IV pilus assembly protein PilO
MRDKEIRLLLVGLGSTVFLVFSGLYGYFGILSPMHQKVETVNAEIKQQETFLGKIKQPEEEEVSVSIENTYSLQEEVPVKPLVDQLILQFEKAEVLSDSLILTTQFSDGEASEDAEEEPTEVEATSEAEGTNEDGDLQNEDEINLTSDVLPEGVKKVTAEMSVVSKDYDGLLKFLRTIEDFKRVTVIEAIIFSGQDELAITSAEGTLSQLKYEVTIAAYYLPELTQYLKDLPRVEFPAPNGKENPLIDGDKEE